MDLNPRRPLRLYRLKGSFRTADDDGSGAAAAVRMDAEMWGKLPAELVWEVMLRLPAATHFRFQLVSRQWRQVLTSADFRHTLRRRSRESSDREEEQQQAAPRVIAGQAVITAGGEDRSFSGGGGRRRPRKQVLQHTLALQQQPVDVNLSDLVPRWFWKTGGRAAGPWANCYHVAAAADGLLCVANEPEFVYYLGRRAGTGWEGADEATRYCVVNPVTRTCAVLPPVPFEPRRWLPPTAAGLTIFGHVMDTEQGGRRYDEVQVASYDLRSAGDGGGGGGWEVAAYNLPGSSTSVGGPADPAVALCAGETYLYCHSRVHVLVPGGPGRLVEAAAVDEPSVALLGMGMDGALGHFGVYLVAHGGAVFFARGFTSGADVLGVWRLARARMQWEAVARLDAAELLRLLTAEWGHSKVVPRPAGMMGRMAFQCFSAVGVRETLYCNINVHGSGMRLRVGLNLDTGEWQLVHPRDAQVNQSWPFELRPDLYL